MGEDEMGPKYWYFCARREMGEDEMGPKYWYFCARREVCLELDRCHKKTDLVRKSSASEYGVVLIDNPPPYTHCYFTLDPLAVMVYYCLRPPIAISAATTECRVCWRDLARLSSKVRVFIRRK